MFTEQEQKPSYSVSIDDSSFIKDLRWARKDAKAYLILSASGKLYHGSGQARPTCVMETVDSGILYTCLLILGLVWFVYYE